MREPNDTPQSKDAFKDLGFGSIGTQQRVRLVEKDGSFNVIRDGGRNVRRFSPYHVLIKMSGWRFALMILCWYLFINVIFACGYLFAGMDGLLTNDEGGIMSSFWDAFFFSAQTLTTVGFGRQAPISYSVNALATLEMLVGWMSFAVASGLVYGRFSRPKPFLKFTQKALISPYQGGHGLMFRVVSEHSSPLIEVNAQVIIVHDSISPDGKPKRDFKRVKLERDYINFLPFSWTIVHPINEESPFHGLDEDAIRDLHPEVLVLFQAFDEAFSQSVHARSSYHGDQIVFGAKFVSMITANESDNLTHLKLDDFDLFQVVEPLKIPVERVMLN